jgi:hypothetical protein
VAVEEDEPRENFLVRKSLVRLPKDVVEALDEALSEERVGKTEPNPAARSYCLYILMASFVNPKYANTINPDATLIHRSKMTVP